MTEADFRGPGPRLQVVTWRQHGDDESGMSTALYPAGDGTEILDEIRTTHDIPLDPDGDAEEREDWKAIIYTDGRLTVTDGDILEHNGRKFRINITEVK